MRQYNATNLQVFVNNPIQDLFITVIVSMMENKNGMVVWDGCMGGSVGERGMCNGVN